MYEITKIEGGVCAPKGFKAGGAHCGFRKNVTKKDLGMIVSDAICSVAGVYTTNKVKGAPIEVTKLNIENGYARAIICNSGNANTCAPNGKWIAEETCRLAGEALHCPKEDIIVSSTGVIGKELEIDTFIRGIPEVVKSLSYEGSDLASEAILTTDKLKKEIAISFEIEGTTCKMGAIAKGSGMVNPNMATILAFITTDVAITPQMLQKAFSQDVVDSFNQISIDGETSTNDMAVIMANGLSGCKLIENSQGEGYKQFCAALSLVTKYLSELIAKDGEGATKALTCTVTGAVNKNIARRISKSIVSSSLVKTAVFGEDANWGRILCAVGYTPGEFKTDKLDVYLISDKGKVQVCKDSSSAQYSEELVADILSSDDIEIHLEMNSGDDDAKAWGCDLTYEYVKINGEYRKK